MNETKHAIGVLCQHLNFIFATDLKPEHFRLAKFDKTDDIVVEVFWNLLGKFVPEQTTLTTVHSVKLFLYSLNYESLPFYCLPDDMVYGSRELLLALGFLLGRESLEVLVQEHLSKTPFSTSFNILSGIDLKQMDNSEFSHEAKTITWIQGRIRLNQRMISELDLQNAKLLAKVNGLVVIPSVSELSFNELIALKKKSYGQEFLRKTEFAVALLENHERWIKKQHIFWRWMNSVLAERAKSCRERTLEFQHLESFALLVKNNLNSTTPFTLC